MMREKSEEGEKEGEREGKREQGREEGRLFSWVKVSEDLVFIAFTFSVIGITQQLFNAFPSHLLRKGTRALKIVAFSTVQLRPI